MNRQPFTKLIFLLLFSLNAPFLSAQQPVRVEGQLRLKVVGKKHTHSPNKENLKLKNFNQEALQSTDKIRCYSVEYNEQLRQNNPNFDTNFERWMRAKIAEKKSSNQQAVRTSERTLGDVLYIPVVVHVIHNGESIGTGSNISDSQVQDQINVLNEDFRKKVATPGYNTHPDGADTKIEFVLAKRTPAGTATNGIDRVNRNSMGWTAPPYTTTYIDNTIKPATIWDPTEYMNMWTCAISGGILGYAQFPDSPIEGVGCGPSTANTDGLVMGYQYFGRGLPPPTEKDVPPPTK